MPRTHERVSVGLIGGGSIARAHAIAYASARTYCFLNVRPAGMAIEAGTVKALAVTGPTRLARWPGVPTMAEAGFPGIGTTHWHGLFASSRMPMDTVRFLHRAATEALGSAAAREALRTAGARVAPSASPEAFAVELRAEMAQWAR